MGTLNVLEALRAHAPNAGIIYSSTNKVYGDLEQYRYEESPTRWRCVDRPQGFDEDTPLELIKSIKPDVLVKGGDYTIENIVGAKEVMAANGEVKIIPLEPGLSTSNIIDRIREI